MQELSLNILDIAQNSVKAKATRIDISIEENEGLLCVVIKDNGCGMSEEQLTNVTDPFFTSRTTRAVGLGIPFYKMAAEQTGGEFNISSTLGIGTVVKASFYTEHIDCLPMGNIADTVYTLISCNEDIDFYYSHKSPKGEFLCDTVQLKEMLDGVPLSEVTIANFLREYFKDNIEELKL